jgi:hypothetical protein
LVPGNPWFNPHAQRQSGKSAGNRALPRLAMIDHDTFL